MASRRGWWQTGRRPEHRLEQYLGGVGSDVSSERYDRVVERRRAVALARHYREVEGLSILIGPSASAPCANA